MGHLTAIFGTRGQPSDYGQHSGPIAGSKPGDGGKAEAAKRFGTLHDPGPLGQPPARGAAGRAEAAKRFGTKGQK